MQNIYLNNVLSVLIWVHIFVFFLLEIIILFMVDNNTNIYNMYNVW